LLLHSSEAGSLIEVVGEKGSGKTSLLHLICAINTLENKKTLYVDGSGNFRPERIHDHLEKSAICKREQITEYLRNISFVRIYESDNIFGLLRKMKILNLDYIVIDDLIVLFLHSYKTKMRFEVRRFVREMALIALVKRINIIFTNTILYKIGNDDGRPAFYELFYNDLVRYIHIKALLERSTTNLIDCNIVYPRKLDSIKLRLEFGRNNNSQ
jgi:RecA/RadA recombinase